ncbi:hypothetical protein [Brevundimonas sp.]|uniref:hypothetical protein n=1 Tax=Brevundimonas sp. TaxID=1871086 RepID=UPI00286A4EEA|nr:hypothetical protein [Brevundimonas sp.]
MRHNDTADVAGYGIGLMTVGSALFALSAACAFAAAEHMAFAAALCGPVARHCILCVASAGSLLASAGVITSGVVLFADRTAPQKAVSAASPRNQAPLPRG